MLGSNPWQLEAFSYDSEGRVADKWIFTSNNSAWTTHLNYTYNRAGEVIEQKTDINGEVLYHYYSYNQRGLLDSVFVSTDGVKPSAAEVAYTYTATGAIDHIDYKGSRDVDYGYTIRDWVASINDIGIADTEGTFAALYDYYDNGNVKNADFYNPDTGTNGAQNRYDYAFSYDGLNRLTGADYTDSDAITNAFDVNNLTYNKAGRIDSLHRWDDSGSHIDDLEYIYYNGTNRLKEIKDPGGQQYSWDAGPATFTYDPNGNMVSQSDRFTSISYDHRNLPTHFDLDGGGDVRAFYNGDGQRILKELSVSSYTFYVMNGSQTLAVIKDGHLSHMNLMGSGTFGRIEADGSGNITSNGDRRYYLTDMLGSTRAVVDDNGTLQETFDYYPFGLKMPRRGTTSDNTIEKFTGHEYDEHSGLELYYAGARYLDAAIGQFTSVDPLANQFPAWSPYNYGKNNPNRFTDPTGMASREIMSFGNANYENSFSFLDERREAREKFREFKNSQEDSDEEDDERKSCIGLSCEFKTNSSSEQQISDRFAGLAERAKNDPWGAAGAFYGAASSITGAENIATMEGRGFATYEDYLRAQGIFAEGALMFAGGPLLSKGWTMLGRAAYTSNTFGVGSKLFGIGRNGLPKGILNSGSTRVGWGYIKSTNQHTFRIGIGNNPRFYPSTEILGQPVHFHINLFKVPATF